MTFKGIVVTNHKFDTPPEEWGVLTFKIRHQESGELQFVDIFKLNLIEKAINFTPGDVVIVTIDENDVVEAIELDKFDPRIVESVDLPGEKEEWPCY